MTYINMLLQTIMHINSSVLFKDILCLLLLFSYRSPKQQIKIDRPSISPQSPNQIRHLSKEYITCWSDKKNKLGLSALQFSFYLQMYFPVKCFFSDLQKWKSLSTTQGKNGRSAKRSRNYWKAIVNDTLKHKGNSSLVPQAWRKHERKQF